MKKTIWLYKLTDALGTERVVAVDQPNDIGCIGGCDSAGDWKQFNGDMFVLLDWANDYDMKVEFATVELDLSNVAFKQ